MITLDIEKELEQEYERFIEFGNLLDRRMRTYLVQYLQNKFNPERNIIPVLQEEYFSYFQKALDRIFMIDGLRELTDSSARLKKQVILDTLYWLRKSYQKARAKNPYHDEQQRLEGWAVTPLKAFLKRWAALTNYLSGLYSREELDYLFFREKFRALITSQDLAEISAENQSKLESFLHNILAQWDALLYAKILEFQLSKFAEEEESYVAFMEKKVKEYQKIKEFINPVSDYFGWDMSRKLWQESSFELLQHYDELLQNEASLKELADLLGNLREAEIEIEEETFEKTIVRQAWEVDELQKSEIVGVNESDDLANMLSAEAGLLSGPDTELLFLKKYADKKLMTFRYEDKKLVKNEDIYTEINQRINQKEKGPFIVCVDTSESMHGRPEQIAKVLTLGILKMAMHQDRKAFLINFSIGIQTLNLYDIANSINDIAAFLKMSFYGGTDATLALYEALRQLGTNDYEDADVLLVSDFIMSKIDADVLDQIRHHQQNKNTQFHSLTLGNNANDNVLAVFDTNWVYHPEEKGIIRALTQGFNTIAERF
ncbi:MAG: hypothetical protein AAGJ93_00555 [Bacteroidota bacterium]